MSQQPGGPQGVNVLDFKGHRVPIISFPGNPERGTLVYLRADSAPLPARWRAPYGVPHAVALREPGHPLITHPAACW